MEKYGTPKELVDKLIALGLCQTEEEALEKVASGEVTTLLNTPNQKARTEGTHASQKSSKEA
jgi:hypothetical protein